VRERKRKKKNTQQSINVPPSEVSKRKTKETAYTENKINVEKNKLMIF
jgi:hypothetical protein